MLFEKVFNYKFKGKRDYVPGVDIYNSMLATVQQYFGNYPDSVKGNFHRFLRNHAMIHIHPETEILDKKTCYAHFLIEVAQAMFQINVSILDEAITESYDYDENRLTDLINWTARSAKFIIKPDYSYMEQFVAITKRLHLNLYPDSNGQWIFTKIQIKDIIDPNAFTDCNMELKAGKNFHNKLTQNLIYCDDAPIGDIWFSLLPKGETK